MLGASEWFLTAAGTVMPLLFLVPSMGFWTSSCAARFETQSSYSPSHHILVVGAALSLLKGDVYV